MTTLTELSSCLNTEFVTNEAVYLTCLEDSGAITRVSNEIMWELSCASDPSQPDASCCSSALAAQSCKVEHESFQYCQKAMNEVIWNSYECTLIDGPLVILVVLLLAIVCILATLFWLSRLQARSRVWLPERVRRGARQFWALFLKNWYLFTHSLYRNVKAQVIVVIMAVVLIVIIGLTDDNVITPTQIGSIVSITVNVETPSESRTALYANLRPVGGILFLVAYSSSVAAIVNCIMIEKETRMSDALKTMGVGDGKLMLSYSMLYTLAFIPLSVVLAFETHIGNVFPAHSIGDISLFFLAFLMGMVSFVHLMGTMFTKTRPAVVFTLISAFGLYFLTFLVFGKSTSKQVAACLSVPTCIGIGVNTMFEDASGGVGFALSYARFFESSGSLSLTTITALLFMDTVLYFVVAWYIEQVFPQNGPSQPWNFFLCKSTLDNDMSRQSYLSSSSSDTVQREHISNELEELDKQDRVVRVCNLTKMYSLNGDPNGRAAVNKLRMTFYEGTITVILGHNGAGKSTTMSMLSGQLKPTSGDASVFGRSLRNEVSEVRRSLGMCPQYNSIYPELTVRQHLMMLGALKDVDNATIEKQIKDLLGQLMMIEKLDYRAGKLSGGQKRKLLVAMALLGDSKFVFLDEMSAGMDSYSRRLVWSVLQRNKRGRCIVMATHFLDEADICGDRIAIMVDGHLKVIGSSMYLKQLYSGGYKLSVTVARLSEKARTELQEALSSLQQLPCSNMSGAELAFEVDSKHLKELVELLHELEQMRKENKIDDFGLSMPTLEDVFLRVTDESREYALPVSKKPKRALNASRRLSMLSKVVHVPSAVVALVQKRWRVARSDRKQFLIVFFLPLLFLLAPIMIGNVSVMEIIDSSDGVKPIAGAAACETHLSTTLWSTTGPASSSCCNTETLSDENLETCLTTHPQCIVENSRSDLVSACTQHSVLGYCVFVPWLCDLKTCCDPTDYRSPLYACRSYKTIDEEWNFNRHCPTHVLGYVDGFINAFIASVSVLIAFVFVPSSIIAYAVLESEPRRNTKLQQFLSGIGYKTFWMGSWIWDQFTMAIPFGLALVIIPTFDNSLSESSNLGVSLILCFAYATSVVPFAYAMSFRYTHHSHALAGMIVFNLITGAALGSISYILKVNDITITSTLSTATLMDILRYPLLILPSFAFIDGLLRMQVVVFDECVQETVAECENMSTAIEIAGFNVVAMITTGVLSIMFVWIFELRLVPKSARRISNSNMASMKDIDGDVRAERKRLSHGDASDPLQVLGLTKQFSKRRAVNDLWLGVKKAECFAFLGVNGAGKSTTMRCIIGQERPTEGRTVVVGHELSNARKYIGYCAQFDALFDVLTVREHINLYARLRGIMLNRKNVVDALITDMQLGQYTNVQAQNLSGGNRRKLCFALSIISAPPVLLLDEPSTGMDASAKRFLWRSISHAIESTNAAALLTTHSIEEVEALCSRAGILIDGELKAIGTLQYLKSKFGRGYTMEVRVLPASAQRIQHVKEKLNEEDVLVSSANVHRVGLACGIDAKKSSRVFKALTNREVDDEDCSVYQTTFVSACIQERACCAVRDFVLHSWSGANLEQRHDAHQTFLVPRNAAPLSSIFKRFEAEKKRLHIAQYAIAQSSLEQIFNEFADKQDAAKHTRVKV